MENGVIYKMLGYCCKIYFVYKGYLKNLIFIFVCMLNIDFFF